MRSTLLRFGERRGVSPTWLALAALSPLTPAPLPRSGGEGRRKSHLTPDLSPPKRGRGERKIRRIAVGCLAAVLSLLAWLPASGQRPPPAPVAGDEQDLILLADARPYFFRLHLQSEGKPAQSVWNDYVDALFAFLDADGD